MLLPSGGVSESLIHSRHDGIEQASLEPRQGEELPQQEVSADRLYSGQPDGPAGEPGTVECPSRDHPFSRNKLRPEIEVGIEGRDANVVT